MDFRKILTVMIEPITHLYYSCYKLYAFFNKENPSFQYGILFGVMVFLNVIALITLINNKFPSDSVYFIIGIMSIVLELIVSHFEDRIVKRYDNMSKQKKIIGNIIFIVEIIITILSFILIIRGY